MGYASKLGRARVSSRSPQSAAVCDRCGFVFNHSRLRWQFEWAGASLVNQRILVCAHCEDVPQQQLRAINIPADPVPIQNPRVPGWVNSETDFRTTSGQNSTDATTGIPVPGSDIRITQDGDNRVTQQTGEPPNGLNEFPGTISNQPGNGGFDANIGVPYGNDSVPYTGVLPGVNYVIWVSSQPVKQPMYWVNDAGDQLPFVSG